MQAHHDDRDPGEQRKTGKIFVQHLTESRGCRAETDENRRKTEDEKHSREENVAPRAGLAAGGDLFDGRSGNKRKVRRNQR